jgi:hypothetical protein
MYCNRILLEENGRLDDCTEYSTGCTLCSLYLLGWSFLAALAQPHLQFLFVCFGFHAVPRCQPA